MDRCRIGDAVAAVKRDYTALDEAILEQITIDECWPTPLRGHPMYAHKVYGIADQNAAAGTGWRLIERRIQAMRKAGKLSYTRKDGWRVT